MKKIMIHAAAVLAAAAVLFTACAQKPVPETTAAPASSAAETESTEPETTETETTEAEEIRDVQFSLQALYSGDEEPVIVVNGNEIMMVKTADGTYLFG